MRVFAIARSEGIFDVPRKKTLDRSAGPTYDAILADVVGLVDAARHAAVRSTNAVMAATYWAIGRRIVEHEQHGAERAGYGEELIVRLSSDLQSRFGRGFGRANLFQMRSFYLAYRNILWTPSGESAPNFRKIQTVSGQSADDNPVVSIAACFPLPWSHYARLLTVRNLNGREFYEAEALRGGWTIRQLNRQIESQFYERAILSKDKSKMLRRGSTHLPADVVMPEDEIKDPYFLEFLALKDKYSETDLESALIMKLERFLLELGGDFTFVGRQRRLRVRRRRRPTATSSRLDRTRVQGRPRRRAQWHVEKCHFGIRRRSARDRHFALPFSALGTVNLRLFADLGRLLATHDHEWVHGMRIAFQVMNLSDRHQSVQDSTGVTPIAFAPGYLDPVGRTVWFTVRKAF